MARYLTSVQEQDFRKLINEAFKVIRKAGYVAKQNISAFDISKAFKADSTKHGYVFTTPNNRDSIAVGVLYVSFDTIETATATVNLFNSVSGLKTEWRGNLAASIVVTYLDEYERVKPVETAATQNLDVDPIHENETPCEPLIDTRGKTYGETEYATPPAASTDAQPVSVKAVKQTAGNNKFLATMKAWYTRNSSVGKMTVQAKNNYSSLVDLVNSTSEANAIQSALRQAYGKRAELEAWLIEAGVIAAPASEPQADITPADIAAVEAMAETEANVFGSDNTVFQNGDIVRVKENGSYAKVVGTREHEDENGNEYSIYQVWETGNTQQFVIGAAGQYAYYHGHELAELTGKENAPNALDVSASDEISKQDAVKAEDVDGVSMSELWKRAAKMYWKSNTGWYESYKECCGNHARLAVHDMPLLILERNALRAEIERLTAALAAANSERDSAVAALSEAYAKLDEVTFSVSPDEIHTRNLISAIRSKIWKALNAK